MLPLRLGGHVSARDNFDCCGGNDANPPHHSDCNATAESTARHLQEVRNILSAMWWRFAEAGDVERRDQTNACLGAVIAAQATMEAADAYMARPTKATRAALARACRRTR